MAVAQGFLLFAGLLILVRLGEKEKAGRYGRIIILASPFVGSAVIFTAALLAMKLSEDFASSVKFETAAFATALSFGLHAVFLAAAAAPREVRKK